MFKKIDHEFVNLENEIARIHALLSDMAPTDEDYNTTADQLTKLYKMREHTAARHLSKDAMVAAGVNILGIAVIVWHERDHTLTSKALGFVQKLR